MAAVSEELLQAQLRLLLRVDFQLAFLALLTLQGLKPLSRWERPLEQAESGALEAAGLGTAHAQRTALSGKRVVETLFSPHPALLDLYLQGGQDRMGQLIIALVGLPAPAGVLELIRKMVPG